MFFSVSQYLRNSAKLNPDGIAVSDGKAFISYKELLKRSSALW